MAVTENWKEMSNRERMYHVANATKNALLLEWKREGCFKDKNNLTKSGILPESIGLVSLLLMLVVFRDDEKVLPKESVSETDASLADIGEVVNASLARICELTKGGFGIAPLLKKNSDIFVDGLDYTETVTWCLSAAILATYAEQCNALTLDADLHEATLDMMAGSLRSLLSAQRNDGAWGFTSDGKGKKSLYYTYIANATLADFFDYILDEISIVEKETDIDIESRPNEKVLNYLDQKLGIDTKAAVTEAREKLDKFLIFECLPLLPKLASCVSMSEDELSSLGAWNHTPFEKKYYHNLYYTYYLLEMMVTSNADRYFDRICLDDAVRSELLAKYEKYLDVTDLKYYKTNFEMFFTNYYEQALHASRMNYLMASRTGVKFWNSSDAELELYWEHESEELTDKAVAALDQSKATLSDATILPMSLKANTIYSYYVTEKPEITIERLFNDVCHNAYNGNDDENEDCVSDLWDDTYYNLFITERSIESIIDFYDYLNKFDKSSANSMPVYSSKTEDDVKYQTVTEPSAIDAAIEAKIAQYLSSESGKQAIISAIGATPVTNSANDTSSSAAQLSDYNSISGWIKELTKNLNCTALPGDDDPSNEVETLLFRLTELDEALALCRMRRIFAENNNQLSDMELKNNVRDSAGKLHNQYKELLTFIKKDLNEKKYELPMLYTTLKRSKDDNN